MNILQQISERIDWSRGKLESEGYSKEKLDTLFGDENLYFPTTSAQLATTIQVVDLIIKNNQIPASEKSNMIELGNKAFKLYRVADKEKRAEKLSTQKVEESLRSSEAKTRKQFKDMKTRKQFKDMKTGVKVAVIAGSAIVAGLIIWLIARKK